MEDEIKTSYKHAYLVKGMDQRNKEDFDNFLIKVDKLGIEYITLSFMGLIQILNEEDNIIFELTFSEDVEPVAW